MQLTILLCFFLFLSSLLYNYLLQQSKKPTGFIGRLMMRIWNKTYLPMVIWVTKDLTKENPKQVLDIGIGNGLSTRFLAEMFVDAKVYGIDISPEAIEICKKRDSNIKKPINFSLQSITHTNFSNKQFQLITAFQTHFHWNNFEKSFEEIHRILDDNGLLLISCEYSKIKYFLKGMASKDDFALFLHSKGFALRFINKKNDWICYTIFKIMN